MDLDTCDWIAIFILQNTAYRAGSGRGKGERIGGNSPVGDFVTVADTVIVGVEVIGIGVVLIFTAVSQTIIIRIVIAIV